LIVIVGFHQLIGTCSVKKKKKLGDRLTAPHDSSKQQRYQEERNPTNTTFGIQQAKVREQSAAVLLLQLRAE
jgi:hypothetical protein